MLQGMVRVALATAAFGLVHSLLAGHAARRASRRLLGGEAHDGLFRALYTAQSAATFGALVAYAARQPARTVYHLRGPAALVPLAAGAAGLAGMLSAAAHNGLGQLLGWDNLRAWLRGGPVPPAPVGQGPHVGPGGRLEPTGPFRHSRNPINLFFGLVVWGRPRMTTTHLAFNLVVAAYVLLGSVRTERRMRAAFGRAFGDYRAAGVPFFLPRPTPAPLPAR